MLKTKILNSLDITPKELGDILSHFNFAGIYNDSQTKRVFCSCGYEAAKAPENHSYGDFKCPQCQGKLMREYSWNNSGTATYRVLPDGKDRLNFCKFVFTVEKSSDKSQFLPRLNTTEIGYIKKDVNGDIIEAVWPTENIPTCKADEILEILQEFFKDNKRFSEVFKEYGLLRSFSSTWELKTLIEGMNSYPNIFCVESLNKKPRLIKDFVNYAAYIDGYVYPNVDADSVEKLPWSAGDEIPWDSTIEDISRIFGCPDELFPFNDEIHSFKNNKTVLNYKDISNFFKTPLGVIALNRCMNGIINWDEMIRMYFVGIALREKTFYKNASNYSYNPHKASRDSEMFSSDEISIFMDYFRDSIDRYMDIFKVIQHFEKNIKFLRSAGLIPDETNIRDRVCNSIRNSQKHKTLKGTDIQELMKSNPLEAAARLRGLL